ncbi:MAG: transcriptional regulator GcvA [Pseudomonadota bacterium]
MTRPRLPLNALRAFETAARHLSFTKAAAELNVTPAAVSHQVKALEDMLGVVLFLRLTRALRLTEAGQAALPLLNQGFDKLAKAVDQLQAYTENDVLRVSVGPSFGALWLVPRLDDFRMKYPKVELRIDGTDRLVNLAQNEADVAIRYGPGGYTDLHVDRLFGQVNTPVCSPDLLRGPHPIDWPADLRHHTLLHIDWKEAEATWRMWLLAAGVDEIDPTRGPRFTHESMAVQAALDGQGVALLGEVLISDHLDAGRLVRPFGPSFSKALSFSFYLLSRRDRIAEPKIAAFRDWLLSDVRKTDVAVAVSDHP